MERGGEGGAAGDEAKISRVHERVHPFNPGPIVIPSYEIHIIACVLCGFPREACASVVTSSEDVMRLFDGTFTLFAPFHLSLCMCSVQLTL